MNKNNLLSRAEMKKIIGGGACRVATRNADGSWRGWSERSYSVEEAQDEYNDPYLYEGGVYVSGYCCASCPF
jgi:hypothetical protein